MSPGESRFVGYDTESEKLVAETLRKYIFGGHVSDYMKKVSEISCRDSSIVSSIIILCFLVL